MAPKRPHPLAARVGRRIAQLRKLRGWNQEELGRRCAMGQKRVSDLERGVKSPQLDTLGRVADALRVDVCELLLPDDWKRLSSPEAENRRILGFLQRNDERTRRLLRSLLESVAEFQAAPASK